MEFEIIIYIFVIIFLLYRSWLDPGTSIIRKTVIFILCAHLFLYYSGDIFKTKGDSEPAHCKFMRELLDENLMADVTPETVGENISREASKIHDNLIKITEKAYACNCESSSEYMEDGKSLKEIYSSRCDNKCKFMDRPLTKCNSNQDCDFPAGCFHYDDNLKLFQPHNSESELGVCVLEGSTHHISDIIQMYQGVEDTSSQGDNIITYLSDDNALPFCHQPSTVLKKVIDFNEDNKHYVETDESQGHHCCLKKTFDDPSQLDKVLSFTSEFWKEHHDAIINRAVVILLTNLGIMGAKMAVALQEARSVMSAAASADEVALAALRAEGVTVGEFRAAQRASSLLELGRSVEYSRAEPISIALRWTLFGGRGEVLGRKFPGLFGYIETINNFIKGTFVAKGLSGVVLKLTKAAGLAGELAATRATQAAEAVTRLSSGARALASGVGRVATGLGERAAESALGKAGGAVLARGAFAFARTLTTGPVGAALAALQVIGAVLDNYDVGGYQNALSNKELLKLFDQYTGAYIDGMKAATNKDPPYAVDIVSTFFDNSGEKLIWPLNRCVEGDNEDCSIEYIKNHQDKEAAKAMIIIVTALKEAEADEITDKMGKVIKNMAESIKDNQVYMDFLDEYKTSLDSGSGNTETEKTAGFLNEWMLDMISHGYTAEEAIDRDRKYAKTILRKLNEKMPNLGYKYLGGANQDGNTLLDYSELTGAEKLLLSQNSIDSPLVYLNTKLSPQESQIGSGIQLTKRGVKLYNRYRNLRADPPQEYIAFSKYCIDIADKLPRNEPPQDGVTYTYQLYKKECHLSIGINENNYPGLAQGTMLNKLDHICRYGTKWGKEGAAVDTTQWGSSLEDLRDSWVYMKNGVPDTINQPFSASDRGPIDPCPYACVELNEVSRNELLGGEHHQTASEEDNLLHSKNNFNSRMMAYNYNIYMRENTSSSGGDAGFEDNNNPVNDQDPNLDYSGWRDEWSVSGIDDWKEWRGTALVAYLGDPADAIDDENFACNISEQAGPAYCHRMAGNDDTFTTDLWYGGIGTLKTTHNESLDRDPVKYADRKHRVYNECIKSWEHEALEDMFGTSIVTSVERFFDWF
tara:strand:+ start:3498 stop:6779 length:3282 start_codon:yes stop_codon:yes gene_type:complete